VYLVGSQWPKEIKDQRKEPCLEFPQQKQFVNQVINEQRQNRPGIRVHPAGGEASKDTAQTLHPGLIRGIEYDSNAEAAYDTRRTSTLSSVAAVTGASAAVYEKSSRSTRS
jgi:hypothetical protein